MQRREDGQGREGERFERRVGKRRRQMEGKVRKGKGRE